MRAVPKKNYSLTGGDLSSRVLNISASCVKDGLLSGSWSQHIFNSSYLQHAAPSHVHASVGNGSTHMGSEQAVGCGRRCPLLR